MDDKQRHIEDASWPHDRNLACLIFCLLPTTVVVSSERFLASDVTHCKRWLIGKQCIVCHVSRPRHFYDSLIGSATVNILTDKNMLQSDRKWRGRSMVRSLFSHHASVVRISKNPITPVLLDQSVMLSVLSVLIGQQIIWKCHGDTDTTRIQK